ncbi:MAG TPA: methyl-accepting chemotaxis protein [Desulfuromonadaceae bacterium]
MKRPYVRKTYYIKNSAQRTFILRFVTISLLGGTIAVFAFNFFAYRKIESVLYSMRLPKVSAGGLLWQEMVYTNIFVIFFTLLMFAVTAKGLYTMLNGPLKELTDNFQRMIEGNLCQTVSLRENEEFQAFADEVNSMREELHRRFQEIRQVTTTIGEKTNELALAPDQEAANRDLKDAIAELETMMGSFKV